MSRTAKKRKPEKKTAALQPNGSLATHGKGSSRWTFLTNHAHVLVMIHTHPEMVLREIALEIGITERAVQRIILELEEAGYLTREKVGRRNSYQVVLGAPLRHSIESHLTIGSLLELVES